MIKIKSKYKNIYLSGNPLITKDVIYSYEELEDGSLQEVVDEKGRFIGSAYIGKQNKGIAWMISNEKIKMDFIFFKDKLNKAITVRKKFFDSKKTTGFRVFNGEGDGIGGLTVDYFDGYYLFNWYNSGIYCYKEKIIASLMNLVECKGIYEKRRFETGGKYMEGNDFVCGMEAENPLIILENNIKYAIYLNDGPMVGIFLDQRNVRNSIRKKYSSGKKVLNLFSYTGAFSVAAAFGGAKRTVSVDLARRSVEKTKENFEINDIKIDDHEIIVADVFDFFDLSVKRGDIYDMVILDPPSHSKSKKKIFSVDKNYKELIKKASKITTKNGVIVASTNHSGYNYEKFLFHIKEALSEESRKYEIIEEFRLPEDFRINKKYNASNYLKVIFIKVKWFGRG